MTAQDRAIRSICVAGAGLVGLSAAVAFARALPGARITILATPPDPAALADRLPASLPTIHRFHFAAGLDELDLVRSGIASHLLGSRFDHWSASGQPWYHVFDEYGMPAGGAPFHAVWQRVRENRRALPFHRYAAAAALAQAGKFVHPSPDPQSPLANFLYALRLDPDLYRERLRSAAATATWEQGEIGGVERRADGGIAALLLKDGRRIEADLYLDCAGPTAPLLHALDPRFEIWSEWLPCDRLVLGNEPAEAPAPFEAIEATGGGWRLRSPLPDRTLIAELSCSAFAESAPDAIALRCGRRPDPWIHNVLALGDAAVAVDPLHSTNLHLAQSAILRALELLPGRDCHELELREYNRRTAEETARIRDFLALHYLRSGRRDSPFWEAMAGRRLPDSLARTLEQFERRGRLPFFEEESFNRQSWLAALLGLGVLPLAADPLAAGVDLDRAGAAMEGLAERLAALAGRAPPYADLLARMRAAARP